MSDTASLTRDQIAAAIAQKAWTDEAFHKQVLANPNEAYEQHTGQKLPPGLTLKVVEDTPSTVHFVIPAKPPSAGELSDSELENVAGGVTPTLVLLGGAGAFFSATAVAGVTKKNGKW